MKKNMLFLILAALTVLLTNCGKADEPQSSSCTAREVPASIYEISTNPFPDNPTPTSSVVGTWQMDSLELTFNADLSWNISLVTSEGTQTNASGTWAVTIKDGIHYLKLTYTNDTFYVPTGVDGEGNPVYGWVYNYPYASIPSPNRVIIVEYFVDDNYFTLNSYRKNDSTDTFAGAWVHNNYQYYPILPTANYNRSGTLAIGSLYEQENQGCNTLTYSQTASPYFEPNLSTGDDLFRNLTDVSNAAASFSAEYSLGDEALSWFNAGNTSIMPDNAGFKIIVMRTASVGTFLLTYPFTKKP